ncbi:hypothetical protein I4F81_007770 [Pyropia yezoensis]|uniref:Uncharacterized protein n=1 Tax=Pyropia yezoensis TaxID=2788 RepID=A0ACC3C665_PYRYE|nr:hypothetical protein I4F81_007770 [Neopyropia yezoensis]
MVAPGSVCNNAVGTVDAVGDGVFSPAVGDRVSTIPLFPLSRHPVYGRHVVIPASVKAAYFEYLNPQENAALRMQVATAYGALVIRAPIARGDEVLVIPTLRGVDKAAIELVFQVGGGGIGVIRSAAKAAAIRDAGAAHVIVTSEEDLVEQFIAKGLNCYGYSLYEVGTDAAALDPLRALVVKGVTAGAFKPGVGKVLPF